MIRKGNLTDIDEIANLRINLLKEVNSNDYSYDWEEYRKILKEFYYSNLLSWEILCYIFEDNKEIVAMSCALLYNTIPLMSNLEGRMSMITDLYVLKAYRNKGIGTNLMINIMDDLKKMGYKRIHLNATKDGEKLYRKLGFEHIYGDMIYKI